MIPQVPEIYDGGYWYVVNMVQDAELGGMKPDLPDGLAFAAWFSDGARCVVKLLNPVAVQDLGVHVSSLVAYPRKPIARFWST